MTALQPPLYQTTIQKLPKGGMKIAHVLGLLVRQRMKAVVNQAVMRLDLRESIQRAIFVGIYEPTQTEWFRQCLGRGDIVVDIGASFGYYTTLGSMLVGNTGKVFAFEPSPIANTVIEDAITDSAISNIVLTKAAVGSQEGSTSLFLPSTPELHSPSILVSDSTFVPIPIPLVTLDNFEPLRSVKKIKLVKIDVEGYEPNVLDGMEGLIRERRIENIICEFNSGWLRRNNGITPQKLLDRFLGFGYRIRAQTKFQSDLVGRHGELFDLQDIWFSLSNE
jgi:FkbM family methyltransferase